MRTKINVPGGMSLGRAGTAKAALALLTVMLLLISAGMRPTAMETTEAQGVWG